MPFTEAQPEDSSHLRDMAYGWGKIAFRRAYGDEGPGLDLDFDSIESMAVEEALENSVEASRRSPALSSVFAGVPRGHKP